jgi:hypothetical protein
MTYKSFFASVKATQLGLLLIFSTFHIKKYQKPPGVSVLPSKLIVVVTIYPFKNPIFSASKTGIGKHTLLPLL